MSANIPNGHLKGCWYKICLKAVHTYIQSRFLFQNLKLLPFLNLQLMKSTLTSLKLSSSQVCRNLNWFHGPACEHYYKFYLVLHTLFIITSSLLFCERNVFCNVKKVLCPVANAAYLHTYVHTYRYNELIYNVDSSVLHRVARGYFEFSKILNSGTFWKDI
jgi:hypothetical protein